MDLGVEMSDHNKDLIIYSTGDIWNTNTDNWITKCFREKHKDGRTYLQTSVMIPNPKNKVGKIQSHEILGRLVLYYFGDPNEKYKYFDSKHWWADHITPGEEYETDIWRLRWLHTDYSSANRRVQLSSKLGEQNITPIVKDGVTKYRVGIRDHRNKKAGESESPRINKTFGTLDEAKKWRDNMKKEIYKGILH